jgi:Kdo2-lipid IVA lauroyltransferase/acyltransferase
MSLRNNMNLFTAFFFLLFVFLTGIMPFFLLYLFSDFIRFMLQYVIGYRREVIRKNLSMVFPKINKQDQRILICKIYKNLADVVIEGIKSFTMTRLQVRKRHFILNPDILDPYLKSGKSIIAVTAHYNNFEWGSLSPGVFTNYNVVAFYKPMSNIYIDRFARRSRSKFGTTLASIKETSLTFERFKDIPTVYLMAADQSPSNHSKAIWVNFLGIETSFLHGPEKHAVINNFPVFYIHVERVKRGYYTCELSLLAGNPSELPEGEITRRYAAKVESIIRNKPENWLWSHRRWKVIRQPALSDKMD